MKVLLIFRTLLIAAAAFVAVAGFYGNELTMQFAFPFQVGELRKLCFLAGFGFGLGGVSFQLLALWLAYKELNPPRRRRRRHHRQVTA